MQPHHSGREAPIAGQYDVVVVGGVESMSRVPMGSSINGQNPLGTSFLERYHGVFPNQGVGAEMIAEQWGFSRAQLDEFSLASHERAAAAQDEGRFDAQIAHAMPQPIDAELATDGIDASIVTAMIGMGRNLRMQVVAEGVETRQQLEILRENGCHHAQGYYFGRPVPSDQFSRNLECPIEQRLRYVSICISKLEDYRDEVPDEFEELENIASILAYERENLSAERDLELTERLLALYISACDGALIF